MKQISGKELCKILRREGWRLARVHGSHHVFVKDGERARLSVPVHGNTPLKKGLLGHLLKLAGIGADKL